MRIETAYDKFHLIIKNAIEAYCEALMPAVSMRELDDNVVIENNDAKLLANGFSILFGPDENKNDQLSSITGINQTVYVTFTTANHGSIKDMALRKAAEKRLMAYKDTAMKAIGANPQLDDTVASCLYNGSDGFELVIDENEKLFVMIKSTYIIGYYE